MWRSEAKHPDWLTTMITPPLVIETSFLDLFSSSSTAEKAPGMNYSRR